ncbi:hypothetical protein [Loktanella salsilacus]
MAIPIRRAVINDAAGDFASIGDQNFLEHVNQSFKRKTAAEA